VRGRSDHCPAMKGIETLAGRIGGRTSGAPKRPLPRNEGD